MIHLLDEADPAAITPRETPKRLDEQRVRRAARARGIEAKIQSRFKEDSNGRSNVDTHVNFGEIELQFPVRIHLRWPFARHLDAITRIFSCTCNIANSKINNDKESQAAVAIKLIER